MKKKIEKALKNVFFSEGKNIIEYGLVKTIDLLEDNHIVICLKLPNPTMHLKKKIINNIHHSINKQIHEKKKISITIEGPSNGKTKHSIKNILAVASGKGGVGKSTIASNLAVSLVKMGFNVGLLDADIYGPSIPLMFDIQTKDFSLLQTKKNIIYPINRYGVKIVSIGFFLKNGQALVWRGPMVSKVIMQFIHETDWGSLDFLIIDLPPGTGDIHLSLLQEVSLKGIVIVSTSQKIALSDVHRTVEMFRMKSIYVPITGIIENMSYFFHEEMKKKYFFFGKHGVKDFSKQMDIFFLGEIPMVPSLRKYSDLGIPAVMKNEKIRSIFTTITNNILNQLKSIQ
ncbi:Mrp/NBP35 family ATP-binding protein [Blattabacterium cuenoti]|uniref:Mrp/NBP35 family ATP-binding protein n=1 Tax=Blattabacterium cuenoti TaxID=1653831 RepID=UPI00163C544E|nr:Mrp/NBP35 family ATP-binding protein [Blattabacterium cuenoti]